MKLAILCALFLLSCSNQESPKPKFRVGQCIENKVMLKKVIGTINHSDYSGFLYAVYDLNTNLYHNSYSEDHLELNEYKIVPCKEN